MLPRRSFLPSILIGVLAILFVAACAPTQAPQAAEPGGGETAPSQETSSEPSEPTEPATVVIAMYQEPESLNPMISVQTVVDVVSSLALESLLDIDPDGNFVPALATEVPSIANGGLSEDGLTLTYKLRKGVTWADGEPFTSADVKFTWEAIMDPDNVVVSTAGYEDIESIETPDDYTVVIKFSKLYAPALTLFDYVLPHHGFGGTTKMTGADFNLKPLGTGPFQVVEWTSGESIILEKNPNYWQEGKPNIDRIIFRITPSREASVLQIKTGEADVVWDLIEASIPEFDGASDITLWTTASPNVEYLGLNLAARGDPADPDIPHPILGDRRVREAISLAIDRTVLVDKLLYGKSKIATSAIGLGWAADPTITIAPYNPDQARALLEEAGWVDSDGDGIRDKDGAKMSLEITTTSGNKLRELAEQVIQEQLKEVGIELVINNVPSATLFGGWDAGGPLKRGNFDIAMDTWGPGIDPDAFLTILFHSSSIPTEENGGQGWNFFRLKNPDLDRAIEEGRSTLDIEQRKVAYAKAARLINDTYAYIPLYNRLEINAFRNNVTNWTPNPWEDFTWDAEERQVQK